MSPIRDRKESLPRDGQANTLDAERWRRTKALFLEALDRAPDDRPAFLLGACPDDAALREEVQSLLASEQAAGGFCEIPAAGMLGDPAADPVAAEPRLRPGTRLGQYEIIGFMSAGGMGEVYRARHAVLGRPVAIKTMPASQADASGGRRLVREARHASRLQHPNICTIFEVGDADGTPFIVMELVEGEPLSARVAAGAVPAGEMLRIGIQVADALEHAHRHGIVHRDLKSGNVMLDPAGRVVVLDFGLARPLPDAAQAADPTVTRPEALAGTLSYMAPEVLRGEPADARSDVWSLGVLLYELATGTLPFHGRTPFETSSAILDGVAPRMATGMPFVVRLVIERCLAKDPAARYQHAAEVRDALERIRRRRAWPIVGPLLLSRRRRSLAAGALLVAATIMAVAVLTWRDGASPVPAARVASIAVLPLEHAAGDSTAALYALGLTEGILEQLGTTAEARVISPVSAAHAASTAASGSEAARLLGADALLEGRLRRSGNVIAVDLRLVEPIGGRVIWSDSYERSERQVLALQGDIVRAIAAEVRLTLRGDAGDRLVTARTVNPEAYEAYLKGRFEWNKRTTESLQLAASHFQRAIELDPTYAPAHAALADCYNQFGTVMLGTGSPREYRPRAAAAAIHALQIDPASAEAHAALGYVRHYDWQWTEAEREFRTAIRLNPSYALAHVWYANLLMSRGRMDEALGRIRTAQELDPFSLIVNTNVAWILTAAGRNREAIAHLERTLSLDSTYVHAHWRLVAPLLAMERGAEARAAAARVVRLTDRLPGAVALLAEAEAATGRTGEARALLQELLSRAESTYVPPASVAGIYEALGDRNARLAWLTRAVDERSNAIAYERIDSGPWLNDPAFRALADRVRRQWQ